MRAILDIMERHKAGEAIGIPSICSAHPLVIAASCAHGRKTNAPFILIEATSNQVNQDGGYTGMRPADFRDFVFAIAREQGLGPQRVILGGDHLGPNAWQHLNADEAMAKADILIDQYVTAGFRKIHLDCSMACADDQAPLTDAVVAERAARLCRVAEEAFAKSGGEPPVYVIGTEVPVPGGAAEELEGLSVTTPEQALETLSVHCTIFADHGLADAWERVIATVVQPGVEFDHRKVVVYEPEAAVALSAVAAREPRILFEAHSTDYQPVEALSALVRDHFAILKVGPGVTFALREALWALDAMEREWIEDSARANLRDTAITVMRDEPGQWQKYYHSEGDALTFDLNYSLSDRIRYYWPHPVLVAAQDKLFANLDANPAPLALVSQHLPGAVAMLDGGRATVTAKDMVMAHIATVLDVYNQACGLGPTARGGK